jgi:hypothetical protein
MEVWSALYEREGEVTTQPRVLPHLISLGPGNLELPHLASHGRELLPSAHSYVDVVSFRELDDASRNRRSTAGFSPTTEGQTTLQYQ